MSAAEMLKAEMASLVPVKASRSSTTSSTTAASAVPLAASPSTTSATTTVTSADDVEIPGLGGLSSVTSSTMSETPMPVDTLPAENGDQHDDIDGEEIPAEAEDSFMTDVSEPRGVKRRLEEVEAEEAEADVAEEIGPSDEEEAPAEAEADTSYALKVNPDGTVEQEDTVKCAGFLLTCCEGSLTVLNLGYGNQDIGNGTTDRSSV